MGILRFYCSVVREGLRHSLDIAQAVIFVLLICAGIAIKLYPSAKAIGESANLTSLEIATYVFCAIVLVRLVLAPYWIFNAQSAQLSIATETLSRIAEDRPLRYLNIAPRVIGNDFHKTPIWTVERIELLFDNLGDRIISYKIAELFFVHEGNKTTIPLLQDAGGYIHARQQISFGFDVKGLIVRRFPAILEIGFIIEYDNVPPIKKRGTKRIIRYAFRSFAPMYWDSNLIAQDEYWV